MLVWDWGQGRVSLCSQVELSNIPAPCFVLPSSRIIKLHGCIGLRVTVGGQSGCAYRFHMCVSPLSYKAHSQDFSPQDPDTCPRRAEQRRQGRHVCSQWYVKQHGGGSPCTQQKRMQKFTRRQPGVYCGKCLVLTVSSRTARALYKDPVLKTNKQTSQHLEAETGGSLQVKVSLLYIEFQDSQGYLGSLGMAYNLENLS